MQPVGSLSSRSTSRRLAAGSAAQRRETRSRSRSSGIRSAGRPANTPATSAGAMPSRLATRTSESRRSTCRWWRRWSARRSLPGPSGRGRTGEPLPLASLLLTLSAATFGIGSTVPRGWATVLCIVLGLALPAGFVAAERGGAATALPKPTYRRGNHLKWIHPTVAVYCTGVMTETFIPLFGQESGGPSPPAAGLLGATVPVGRTSAQLFSVGMRSERARGPAIRLGPAVLTAGPPAYGLLQTGSASGGRVLLGAVVLIVGGTGIGVAFPHLSVTAMRSTDDEAEGGKAAAGLDTTQLIAFSVSSAVAGTLVSAGGTRRWTAPGAGSSGWAR
ncbi:hypothetical protein [Kitasatospora sp. NPDC057500]|uniref:hypothetical protein n=1 Tax=Kitasatospora sp. NPDC057500 TaxID=3346151 RepID=UPI00369242B5